MTWAKLALAAIGGMTLGALQAQSAPNPPSPRMLAPAIGVESVALRCWWRGGRRVCGRADRRRYYGYRPRRGYGEHEPEAYPTGSARWWQEMDRLDRGGRSRP